MKINIDSFDIYPKVAFAGTRGSYGADAILEFEFGESWDELSRCVIFYPADGSDAVSVVLGSDTVVKIPSEVMSVAGHAKYVVSGVKGEDIMISVTGDLHIAQTLDAAGADPDAVVPSLADQVISKVTDAEKAALDARAAAEHCTSLIEEYVIDTESARVSAETAQNAKNETEAIRDSILCEEEERARAEAVRIENEEKRVRAEAVRTENYSKLSNALVGEASGTAVKLTDVSPIEHEIDVKIQRAELIPYPYATTDTEINGLRFTYNERTVSFDGVPSNDVVFSFGRRNIKAGRYTVSGFSISTTGGAVQFRVKGPEKAVSCNIINNNDASFDVTEDIENAELVIRIMAIDETVSGIMTPSLVNEDVSQVKLFRYGKNLIDSDLWGDLFEKQADGSYKSVGMVKDTNSARDLHLPAGIYTIRYAVKSSNNYRFAIRYEDGSKNAYPYPEAPDADGYQYRTIVTNGDPIKQIFFNYGEQSNDVRFKDLQIEVGGVATEYEPYIEPTEYTLDDNVMSVSPTTTLLCDAFGAIVDASYNKDANKVVASLEERIAALEAK